MEPIIVELPFLEFPPGYTWHGGNISPAIRISAPTAVSYAVMVFNPFIKSCCSFTPWIIWNLPPVREIPRGIPPGPTVTSPVMAVQGTNDYGEIGYHGPDVPSGELHRYQFRVYGLDTVLSLAGGSTKNDLVAAMQGHAVQYGETVGISGSGYG
jgi:Raf kinase inhibitor-like YbhB/YbcL family protein